MKIIIDNSGYALKNMGDIAMLQVAVTRLQRLFPKCSIDIFTNATEKLTFYCRGTKGLDLIGRDLLMQPWNVFGGARRILPSILHDCFLRLEHKLRIHVPGLAIPWIRARVQSRDLNIQLFDNFIKKINEADLIVATGGGFLNDSFPVHAKLVLKTIQFAQSKGKHTVLFGQGIGPLRQKKLRRLAQDVLPNVSLIGLREGTLGPKVLSELGVSQKNIRVTGDDAIELAYQHKNNIVGTEIGVNLRISNYSQIAPEHIEKIGLTLQNFSTQVNANFRAVPISFYSKESDLSSIESLLGKNVLNEINKQNSIWPSPLTVIQTIRGCRIVVTGSYHAAVFALSQGIPTICLSSSNYYIAKFSGLENQFRGGVSHIALDERNFEEKLHTALVNAWDNADLVKAPLLGAAKEQIESGNDFYADVTKLFPYKQGSQ